jgi:uncharacterized protein YdaU (DUF1376 family)
MSENIWMPIYIGDYLGDTMHLTTEQHGAYLLLIMHYWRSGPIKANEATIMAITRLDAQAYARGINDVLNFFTMKDGCYRHKRVEAEKRKANENQKTNAERAKKAAQARWKNHEK